MFLQALQDLGYVKDRDLQITYRSSDGYLDRLPALAEELVRLNPDVIVAAGLDAVVAVRNVTQTIPIVSATLADAVHLGLIANEARPTGNVTGIEPYVPGLPAKQIEFAREIMPGATKVGLLTNLLKIQRRRRKQQELLAAGRETWKLRSHLRTPIDPRKSRRRLETLANRHVNIVIVLQTSMLLGNSHQIAASALAKRLRRPSTRYRRPHRRRGPRQLWCGSGVVLAPCRLFRWTRISARRSVARRPGQLSFQLKMLLSINLKTASRRRLGLTVPSSLLSSSRLEDDRRITTFTTGAQNVC